VEKLEEMLEAHTGGCTWCRVNAWAGMEQHQLTDCTQDGSDDVRGGVRELHARLQWARYSCCFDCGVPQAICTSYTERLDAGWDKIPSARCQFAVDWRKRLWYRTMGIGWVRVARTIGLGKGRVAQTTG
jgi:hypothetical protein